MPMYLTTTPSGDWAEITGTQADARASAKAQGGRFVEMTIPTTKPEIITVLNQAIRQAKPAPDQVALQVSAFDLAQPVPIAAPPIPNALEASWDQPGDHQRVLPHAALDAIAGMDAAARRDLEGPGVEKRRLQARAAQEADLVCELIEAADGIILARFAESLMLSLTRLKTQAGAV